MALRKLNDMVDTCEYIVDKSSRAARSVTQARRHQLTKLEGKLLDGGYGKQLAKEMATRIVDLAPPEAIAAQDDSFELGRAQVYAPGTKVARVTK